MVSVFDAICHGMGIPVTAAATVFTAILAAALIGFAAGWMFCQAMLSFDPTVKAGQKGSEISFIGKNYWGESVKLVVCLRQDLNMTPGKVAAQMGHASLGMYRKLAMQKAGMVDKWEESGQPKIPLCIKDVASLKDIRTHARSLGLPTMTIEDVGKTPLEAGVKTCVAILGPNSVVDQVTGSLQLY